MLPFDKVGALQDPGGGAVGGAEAIPLSIWPAGPQGETTVGEYTDYVGIALSVFADELAEPDRRLVIDGETYRILSAQRPFLSLYAELRLRRMGSGA